MFVVSALEECRGRHPAPSQVHGISEVTEPSTIMTSLQSQGWKQGLLIGFSMTTWLPACWSGGVGGWVSGLGFRVLGAQSLLGISRDLKVQEKPR